LQATVTDLYGFYGSLTQITASWIAPFLLYAGLLFAYGAFDLILRVAIVAAKYIESGVAQTAVLASAVIGSINGSYTANAAMTGSFTIPTMQESGMDGHRAAGIEAVASTSGQVLPPVMGASAFVMASYLGVPYLDIIAAGLVPAAILVISIVIAVHYTAISDSSSQDMEFSEFFDETLSNKQKLFETVRFGIPFGILIYLLGIAQFTVMTSALYTVVAMTITGVLMPPIQRLVDGTNTGPGSELLTQLRDTVHGFRRGAIILAPIAIILVVISGVVNIFGTTGVPAKIALLLINISGGVLLFAVLLGMLVAILMGVGMPTVAAYVVVAILIVPTFVSDFGVSQITAHYTMFYAAILAGITPPVATAAVVAAGIAEANFWKTCGAAIKIAAPLFVLPIAFVYNPGLIAISVGVGTLSIGLLVLLGAVTMIYGLNYPFQMRPGRVIGVRSLLTALGVVVMVYPSTVLKIAGIAIFVGIFSAEKVLMRDLRLPFSRGASQ
jgi:TRAP transporter 4TM/12TM fusion protein